MIALVCPYHSTCDCNAVLRAPPFKAPSKAHLLIPFKGLIPLILINTGPGVRSNHPTDLHIIWLSILNFMKPPDLFLTQTSEFPFRSRPPFPLHSTSPGASFLPPLPLFFACPHACIVKHKECRGGFNMPLDWELTRGYFTGLWVGGSGQS